MKKIQTLLLAAMLVAFLPTVSAGTDGHPPTTENVCFADFATIENSNTSPVNSGISQTFEVRQSEMQTVESGALSHVPLDTGQNSILLNDKLSLRANTITLLHSPPDGYATYSNTISAGYKSGDVATNCCGGKSSPNEGSR